MQYLVDVVDSYGNESTHEVDAESICDARRIGRNLHLMEKKYGVLTKIPVITTEVTEIQTQ